MDIFDLWCSDLDTNVSVKRNCILEEYRNGLIQAEQKSQDDYDKSIVSLSGGALGLSIIFFKEVLGGKAPVHSEILVYSWVAWASSIATVVLSYFLSRLALRKAIEQTDNNDFRAGVGGWAAKLTAYTNALSGLLFIVGIGLFISFSAQNIEGKNMSGKDKGSYTERGFVPPPPPPPKQPITEGVIPPPPPPPPPPAKGGE